ncbi:phospholipase D-like domain-containing protein [Calidifontibacillus oryziterrae]|uniref:hypothetical protein n=1 Tax=Calidifontibacillus oryziterrae TaxID=1191699 RepID=UPI0002DD9C69|nr:hypothetical protein [Calidifontibacillus oryziterrae]
MIKYTDFFELINTEQEAPIAALFMSYGFDAELFEKHILPNLLGIIGNADENELRFRNQVAVKLKEIPVTVLSDARQYHGGRTFLYDHITVSDHTFHPKCYLLLYETYLRVIVGSCNLTKAGLCYNAETIWYEDIRQDDSVTNTISKNLVEILIWMGERYGIQNNDALKEVIKFLEKSQFRNDFPKLVSTISDKSVFTNLFEEIKNLKEECKALSILSPFYENDRDRALEKSLLLEFVDQFKRMYPKAKIKIYFPAMKSEDATMYKVTAPVTIFRELCGRFNDIELYVIHREWEREDDEPIPRTLHAKIIMAEFKGASKLILSGSINFTNNAMRSKIESLRNIEVGILEYGKIKFEFPQTIRVKVNELFYEDKVTNDKQIIVFVESAVLDNKQLIIKLSGQLEPFKIEYQNQIIYESDMIQETITIQPFQLKRSQDLHIVCKEYDFYVPIQIVNKQDYESEDVKLSFELKVRDIIDYLAGKYRSMSEIERLKKVQKVNGQDSTGGLNVYFRHNLQRYYKAMSSLKQGLEVPFYSEMAFKNYLSNPIGLKNLIHMIIEDYQNGDAGNEETFLFLVEMENVIAHLRFQEDRLEKEYKEQVLADIMAEPVLIRKEIYKKSKKMIRNQFDVLLKTYGLEVR